MTEQVDPVTSRVRSTWVLVGAAALAGVVVGAWALTRDGGSAGVPATQPVTGATDPGEPAPATDPPGTDPPATDPPATDPPATDPPATDPPATDPPATDPPATDPPDGQPPDEPDPLQGLLPAPPPVDPPPGDQLAGVALELEPALDIPRLTAMEWNAFDDAYLAITQDGFVHRIPEDLSGSEVVLDLSGEVTGWAPGSERGLLGIAVDPADGRLFLHFTDRGNDSHVVWYEMEGGRPVTESRREVLFLEQPGLGHQGGQLAFDRDGYLYVAFGDGGGSSGRDAQDGEVLHGSIIRIDPHRDGDGYEVPGDNPFVGDPEWRDEMWVVGLRNPWRFSIDPATGDMWIGDVGEDTREELNRVPAGTSGQNFGWYWLEGTHDRGRGPIPDGVEPVPPVYEYDRSVGVAIIAGRVYHGDDIPELRGAHVFADMTGPLFAYGADGGTRLDARAGGVVTSFAETPDRELLVLTLQDGLFRLRPG